MNRNLLGPLSGLLFIVLLIVSFVVMGTEPPDAEDSAQEIADFYVDEKDSVQLSAVLGAASLVFLVFFANYLRRLFAAAGDAPLSATVLVGVAITTVGVAFDATLSFAIAEAADDIEPTSVETLQALWDNDWVPMALGALIFLISVGVSTIQTGALPAWLGWVALVLAVIAFTPIGFAAFIGTGVWILVVSGLLTFRARGSGTQSGAAAA